ncbi:phospholipid scramblase 1 [Ptychographa xylographoides]|nr:phospholipid scramblase 1 [Ptychographa xylographoides]
MINKILITFLIVDFLFVNTGGLFLTIVLVFKPGMTNILPTSSNAAITLLLQNTPLTVALVNAALIVITFLSSIPGAILAKKPIFLRITSWLTLSCALLSLGVGLDIWYSTLQTSHNLGVLWAQQSPLEQSLLQQQFQCCGYSNSTSPPFIIDNFCSSTATAAMAPGCVGPFSGFANSFLDIVFTSVFGAVAVDGILFLCTLVVLKDRAQRERYRLIDEKSGLRGI